jgi:hypothetical protein
MAVARHIDEPRYFDNAAVGFAVVEARSKVMKGMLAALPALIEALIAAESSARAMMADDLRRTVEISERLAHRVKLPRPSDLCAFCLTPPS